MPTKNLTANRAALGHRIAYALRHPDRVPATWPVPPGTPGCAIATRTTSPTTAP